MRFLILLLGAVYGFSLPAQEKNTWEVLANISIEKRFDETLNFEVDYPTFSNEVKALEGREITVQGWMVPLDELRGENYFVLSAFPFSNCFFCGGAGPETVMEVFSKKNIEFTEKRITLKGRLNINADDPIQLMYMLTDAEMIK